MKGRFNMDLKGLNEGMIVKNYRELCDLLGVNIKDGKSRKLQIEEWKRYFDFERQGNKYIINKIYNTPLPIPKQDKSKKKLSKNDIYTKYVQVILTKHLKETSQAYYTTTDLLKLLGFVNENWGDTKLLSEFCKTHNCTYNQAKYYYNQLYMHVMSYCTTAFKRCLNRLSQRKYINWYEVYRVCDVDERGNILEERTATKAEIDLYTEISYRIKEEMGIGYINVYNAEEYYNKLNNKLFELGLAYMHKAIGISFAKSGIDRAISRSEQEYINALIGINDNSMKHMKNYIDIDIEKDIEKIITESNAEYDKSIDDFKYIYSKDDYVKAMVDKKMNIDDIDLVKENKLGLLDMYIELFI